MATLRPAESVRLLPRTPWQRPDDFGAETIPNLAVVNVNLTVPRLLCPQPGLDMFFNVVHLRIASCIDMRDKLSIH